MKKKVSTVSHIKDEVAFHRFSMVLMVLLPSTASSPSS